MPVRNDPAQYDELLDSWWDPGGPLAMLHWLAAVRAMSIPAARGPRELLVDIGCGAGLLAAEVNGYRHLGLDQNLGALRLAEQHGLTAAAADATALPLPDECAQVVVAGEILEHVADHAAVLAEACRVLAPGGRLVIDTIAATTLARVVAVTLAERSPGGPPRGLHDPALFVDRRWLIRACADHGVRIELFGLRPSLVDYVGWIGRRRRSVRMVRTPSTAVLFAAVGTKGGRM